MSAFVVQSPIGALEVRLDGNGALTHALFRDGAELPPAPTAVAQPFADYFAGDLEALAPLALAPSGGRFRQAVWAELRRIPPGETRCYADIARALGGAASGRGPNARAVGMANAANPVAIVIPCHRVIGSDGRLTGYAGGLERKAWLLRHEGWRPAAPTLL